MGDRDSPQAETGLADDLATLAFLTEDVLREALKTRYFRKTIYTYVGDILIILNPYQDLGLYGEDASMLYRNCTRSLIPPHVFAIADSAYKGVSQGGKNQVCIVSGESGAGKTETTKHLIKHVLSLSHGAQSNIENKIIKSSPVIEAFGNAQTAMNHNSSRFGKFMELHFDSKVQINGISITEYLLERPRVVRQSANERGFHVFYYLINGVDEITKMKLNIHGSYADYNYLARSSEPPDSSFCKNMWIQLQEAFEAIGFDLPTRERIASTLSGILELGNVLFVPSDTNDDGADLTTPVAMAQAAKTLQISPSSLQTAIMTSRKVMRGSTIVKRLSAEQCNDYRDATAKIIYGKMFTWLVAKVSELSNQNFSESKLKICLLDIFGFENFDNNGFEQMCINVANEQLQFFFNDHIFKKEIEEYYREGLDSHVVNITYKDNTSLLALFTGNPLSVFILMNEESKLRTSSVKTLVQKMKSHLGTRPELHMLPDGFAVNHYAGKVIYDADGMINKNRDDVPDSILLLIAASECPFLQQAFEESNAEVKALATGFSQTRKQSVRQRLSIKGKKKTKAKQTVAAQFSASLKSLILKMTVCQPHFLRCIKPNRIAQPSDFDNDYVLDQLRYTGVLETVRIRREGFAARLKFAEFLALYGVLAFAYTAKPPANVASCTAVLKEVKCNPEGYIVGKTKVFLKYWAVDVLSSKISDLALVAIKLQAHVRGFLDRLKYRRIQELQHIKHLEAVAFFENLKDTSIMLEQRLAAVCHEDVLRNPVVMEQAVVVPPNRNSKSFVSISRFQSSFARSHRKSKHVGFVPLPEIGSKKHANHLRKSRKAAGSWFKTHESKRLKKLCHGHEEVYPPIWFHEMITRTESDNRLKSCRKGTFLVRVSETTTGYTLSCKDDVIVRNYKITVEDNLTYTMSQAPRAFDTLQELLDNYRTDILTEGGLTLLVALPRPVAPDEEIEYAEVEVMPDGQVLLIAPSRRASAGDEGDYHNAQESPNHDYRDHYELQQELAQLSGLGDFLPPEEQSPKSEFETNTLPIPATFKTGHVFSNKNSRGTVYTPVTVGSKKRQRQLSEIVEDFEDNQSDTSEMWQSHPTSQQNSRPSSELIRKDSLAGWLPRRRSSDSDNSSDNSFILRIPMLRKKDKDKSKSKDKDKDNNNKRRSWFAGLIS